LDASISVCVLERNGKMKVISKVLDDLVDELTKHIHPRENLVVTKKNELHKAKNAKSTLILFPGGASTAKETKEEFEIISAAAAHQISVVFMNFNRHLWIDDNEAKELASELETLFSKNEMSTNDIYIGGMSIGGNVALSLSNYLKENKSSITPSGVFIVDSPIDLYSLYNSSVKDVSNPNFDNDRKAEPKWIINYFEEEFGKESLLPNIQKVSPFTLESNETSVANLKNCKLRFYTEPDTLWWKENRGTDFEGTNAYAIQQIANEIESKNWSQFELIETFQKGYRANGDRHPHSWSIVDIRQLIDWIEE